MACHFVSVRELASGRSRWHRLDQESTRASAPSTIMRTSVLLTRELRRSLRIAFVTAAMSLAVATSAGCSEHYIPNTDVEDTADNRGVIEFCEKYRKAVERKDINALLKMISPDYYEDGGNPDASDDMDYAQFKKWLTGEGAEEDADSPSFQDVTAIRHEIRYRRIVREKERIFVDYTFSASFRIPTAHGDQWKRKVDDNRLELVPDENGDYKIIAGM
jgi:hypothetical protein